MNQARIIANLNAMLKGEGPIINMIHDGFLTSDWMLDKGMWSCFSCGHLNCLEAVECNGCNDEKFIVRQSYAKFEYAKQKPRHTYYKIIENPEISMTYKI